jgi:CDP-glucose 4,6-dehydratase
VLEPLSGYLWLGARLAADAPGINGEAFNFGPDARVNQTVGQLLAAMQARWPSARWTVPDGNERAGEEAMLLKLSCDKVLFHLGWAATLQFEETVAYTVDWYRAWNEGSDLPKLTLGQIEDYCTLAAHRGALWLKT